MAEKCGKYKCGKCGNIVQVLHGEKPPVMCCGQPKDRLVANTVDAVQEKHVPVVEKIDPSPYQHRKYFDKNSLRELGASYAAGLIEPIIVRPQKKGRFQLIA